MADTAIQMGDDWRLAHDTASDWTTPTWVNQPLVDSIAIEDARAVAEIKKRGENCVRVLTGKVTKSITATVYYDNSDTFVQALESAYRAQTALHLAIGDGDVGSVDTHFWQFWAHVTEMQPTVDQDNVSMYNVTLRPDGNKENVPAYTVGT